MCGRGIKKDEEMEGKLGAGCKYLVVCGRPTLAYKRDSVYYVDPISLAGFVSLFLASFAILSTRSECSVVKADGINVRRGERSEVKDVGWAFAKQRRHLNSGDL